MRKFDATRSLFPTSAAQTTVGVDHSRGLLQHRNSDLARVMAERRESVGADRGDREQSLREAESDGATAMLEEVGDDSSDISARSSDVSDIDGTNVRIPDTTTLRATALYADEDVSTMDIAQVRLRLAALENASGPTQEEIDAMLAQYSDYSHSSGPSGSERSGQSRGDNDGAASVSSDSNDDTYSDGTGSESDSDDSTRHETVIMKVLVVGNARCGKTSTIRQFVSREFSEQYVSTIGADFVEKRIAYDAQLTLCLQLWDIAGQDRFAKLTRAYFREARGALIVCDITRANTVDAVETWKTELDTCARDLSSRGDSAAAADGSDGGAAPLPVVMVANKSDLLSDVASALAIGVNMQKCVAQNGIVEWFRTSAKSGDAIDDAFQCLIDRMVENHRAAAAAAKRRRALESTDRADGTSHRDSVIRLTSLPPLSYDNTGGFGCECN